jgi:hypothetical protein
MKLARRFNPNGVKLGFWRWIPLPIAHCIYVVTTLVVT